MTNDFDAEHHGPSHDPEDLFDSAPEAPPSHGERIVDTSARDESSPEHTPSDGSTPDEPKPARKRRRRRSRSKSSGDGEKQSQSTSQSTPQEPRSDSPQPDKGEDSDSSKKRRRRRSRSKSGRDRSDKPDKPEYYEAARERTNRPETDDDSPLPDDAFPSAPLNKEEADIFDQLGFLELGLRNSVLKGVHKMGFAHPTQIQAQLIPIVLSGRDMLGQARTGSGKTAAFGLPALNMVERGTPFQSLILCPTRELAIQIDREIDEMAAFTTVNSVPVFGGQPIPKQLKRLESNPEIIVATPGRLMDLYEHRHIHFRNIKQIILDEVDRMLDIGFRDDIRNILKNIKHEHQTIFVSATISSDIENLARQFMTDPEKIVTTAGSLTVNTVTQHYCPINRWDKKRLLVHLLTHEEPALTVVFCKTKRMVDALAKHLRDNNVEAQAIHGDLPQGKRNRVMEKLRSGKLSVLVASDLAARGLDVDGITHVVNYDIPEDPEVYIHRIGRTARAGKDGEAWTFVTPEEGDLLTQVEVLANIHIPELEYPDFTPSEPPRGVREAQAAKKRERDIAQSLNRYETSIPATEKVDETKFPGGLVPTKLPPKRIGGKVNTARSQKAVLAEKKAKKDDG